MKQMGRFSLLPAVLPAVLLAIGIVVIMFGFVSRGDSAPGSMPISDSVPIPDSVNALAALSQPQPQTSTPMPTSTILPDLEYIPLYPGAKIISASEEVDGTYRERKVVLEASDSYEEVDAFYKQALPKRGWRVHSDSPPYYIWADPSGTSPWQLELYLAIEGKSYDKRRITIEYTRVPNVENIPLYADAQEVEVHHEEQPGDPERGEHPARITTKTFVTSASKEEIADYYNTRLIEYGWLFHDDSGAGLVLTQTGSLDGEGLYFQGRRVGRNPSRDGIVIDLYITISPEADGRLRVQLRATTTEFSIHV